MLSIAIIGAGGAGAAAARFAAMAGHKVTVFEQFHIDHDRGSSFGPSRIIRRTYPDRLYTALMNEAYELWDELEAEASAELRIRTGGIYFGQADHPGIRATIEALEANGVPFDVLDTAQALELFPAFRFQEGEVAVYQDDSGILKASQCVRSQLDLARRHGAQIREGAAVRRIARDGAGLEVVTASGEAATFDRVAVVAGAWLPRLLEAMRLPLAATRQQQIFLRPVLRPGPSRFAVGRFPVWIDAAADMYGFPQHSEAPGVKVALHRPGEPVDPDFVPSDLDDEHVQVLRRYLQERLPDLGHGDVIAGKVCLYTSSPDGDFVLDAVPDLPGAYFASACSGHGFKFTVLVGKMLVELMEGKVRERGQERFRAARFASVPAK